MIVVRCFIALVGRVRIRASLLGYAHLGRRVGPDDDAYQKGLKHIDLRLAKVIVDYADAYKHGLVPNETAKKLLDEAPAIEAAKIARYI